jgi:putative transposase
MILTYEHKLYPNAFQAKTLDRWLRICCGVYNRSLEHRIKAYRRRGESVTYNQQQGLLTEQRARMDDLRSVPVKFARDALRRVDRGFSAFFRRVKAKQTPGFPRFRSWRRYTSLEYAAVGNYVGDGAIRVPCLGRIRSRGRAIPAGSQKILRVIKRATGWFAQVVVDDGVPLPVPVAVESSVGVDVGLTAFATLSTGEKIANPRYGLKSQRKLRYAQRRLARCQRHSRNRRKAVDRVRRIHELVAAQRRSFCHQEARKLVNRFHLIAFENLNIVGMVRNHRLARSIMDAAWGMFTNFVTRKAEYAGRHGVGVHAPGTSQECPWCGAIKPKSLSEREHRCNCNPGVVIDRDHASGLVILSRAIGGNRGGTPVEGTANTDVFVASRQAGPMKQECVLDAASSI